MSKEKRKGRWLFFGKDKYTYDTIDELVNKSMGLAVGEVVTLNGYYSADDGATHKRVIADTDDGSGVQLRSGKWANIVHNGKVNVSWFGDNLKQALLFSSDKKIKTILNKDYQFTFTNLELDYINLNGKGHKLSYESNIESATLETPKIFRYKNNGEYVFENINVENTGAGFYSLISSNFKDKNETITVNFIKLYNSKFVKGVGITCYPNYYNAISDKGILINEISIENNLFESSREIINIYDAYYNNIKVNNNKIHNFNNVFCSVACNSELDSSNYLLNKRKYFEFKNNEIYSDDEHFFIANKEMYFCPVLIEGDVAVVENNIFRGLKVKENNINFYPVYGGSNVTYFRNNIIKNCFSFNSVTEFAKIKKSIKYICENNVFDYDKQWLDIIKTKYQLKTPECIVYSQDLGLISEGVMRTSTDVVIKNNILRFPKLYNDESSGRQGINFSFTGNRITVEEGTSEKLRLIHIALNNTVAEPETYYDRTDKCIIDFSENIINAPFSKVVIAKISSGDKSSINTIINIQNNVLNVAEGTIVLFTNPESNKNKIKCINIVNNYLTTITTNGLIHLSSAFSEIDEVVVKNNIIFAENSNSINGSLFGKNSIYDNIFTSNKSEELLLEIPILKRGTSIGTYEIKGCINSNEYFQLSDILVEEAEGKTKYSFIDRNKSIQSVNETESVSKTLFVSGNNKISAYLRIYADSYIRVFLTKNTSIKCRLTLNINKTEYLKQLEIPINTEQLNMVYSGEKMKQEGVYNDYITYMDEKTLYDKQQRKLEQDRQLAYEEALKENPDLTYEEFMSVQPMTLNLMEEPQPSENLKKFMDKYL